jgi:hypothetical protein
MGVFPKDVSGRPSLYLKINEPHMARAFREFFMERWNQITDHSKDKSQIIDWFRTQVQSLERSSTERFQ